MLIVKFILCQVISLRDTKGMLKWDYFLIIFSDVKGMYGVHPSFYSTHMIRREISNTLTLLTHPFLLVFVKDDTTATFFISL